MQTEEGTYALLLRAPADSTIEVGALGAMRVRPGSYVYVGSAFGPGGVRARVRRHARAEGTLHWHVDYLRRVTVLDAVWYTYDSVRHECTWADVLRGLPAASVPKAGFGASDCDCPAHLVAFDAPPALSAFRDRLHACCPDHAALEQSSGAEILD